LIRRAEAITRTKGGIVIPEKAQAKVLQGEVVAVGPGMRNNVCILKLYYDLIHDVCNFLHILHLKLPSNLQKGVVIPICVKVGDKVLLPEYGGTKVQTEDEKEYHLFRESDILAKLDS
jgi:chaperonin GroES